MRGQGRGWVTAEYGMLPRATGERTARSSQTGGRAQEIQRLIGRSLRAVTDLGAFGERTIILDCDVLEADGGTRTAAINGALVALHDAFVTLSNKGQLTGPPLKDSVAAISVGLIDDVPCLDLAYAEDSRAQVDMNVVMTGTGRFVEVQGTGESRTFSDPSCAACCVWPPPASAASCGSSSACWAIPGCSRSGDDIRRRLVQSRQAARAEGAAGAARARAREHRRLSGGHGPDETGETLLANARIKAAAAVAATGQPAIADDTGLEVDALDGAPGVLTARFAGADATYADNVRHLLAVLADVPDGRRTARFRTVCVAHFPDGRELRGEGVLEGRITERSRGTGGFGYDSVFEVPDLGRTLAELTPDQKNALSHRARAVRDLAHQLRS
jgi:XTP/dITP diphosphohydrolase